MHAQKECASILGLQWASHLEMQRTHQGYPNLVKGLVHPHPPLPPHPLPQSLGGTQCEKEGHQCCFVVSVFCFVLVIKGLKAIHPSIFCLGHHHHLLLFQLLPGGHQ